MKRRVIYWGMLLILIVMMLPIQHPTVAQNTEEQWFYAYNYDTYELVAYHPQGDINVLYAFDSHINIRPFVIFPDSSALIVVEFPDESTTFFALTPTSADPIDLAGRGWHPVVQNDRYVVMNGNWLENQYYPAMVYDNLNHTRLPLPNNPISQLNIYRFSVDGEALRYIKFENGKDSAWSIRRLDLETGEDELIFAPEAGISIESRPMPDPYGAHWIWLKDNGDGTDPEKAIIHADGGMEVFQSESGMVLSTLWDNTLVERPIECDLNCRMFIHRPDGDPVQVQIDDLMVDTVTIVNDDTVVASDGIDFYLLTPDNPPRYVGYRYTQYAFTGNPMLQVESGEGYWLAMLEHYDRPETFYVWDLNTHAITAEVQTPDGEMVRLRTVFYRPNGMVVETEQPLQSYWLDAKTGDFITLPMPDDEIRHYYELLSDDTFLLLSNPQADDENMMTRYWHYDPATETYTPTLPDGTWDILHFPDLNHTQYAVFG